MNNMKKYLYDEVYQDTLKYFNGDVLATTVWINKYCLKDSDDNYFELTPDDMHKRIADEFGRIESYYPNAISSDDIYDLLKDFKYIIPGGSPMSGIGNNLQTTSISNCFVIGNKSDSYGGICKLDEQLVQIMKRRGGVGLDISHLRPSGTKVKNSAGTSTGAVSFMDRYSNSTREVAQDGRRGALMLSIDVRHPDTEKFINAKLQDGKVTGANISVKITDEFMKCVIEDKPFKQQFPIDSEDPKIIKEIDAKALWEKLMHNAWKSGEPGVLFIDTIWREGLSDIYNIYKTVTCNPCGEIPMSNFSSCILLALNLYSYVINPFTDKAYVDFELLSKHAYIAQKLCDNIIDLEIEKVNKILEKIKNDSEPDDIKLVELTTWINILEMLQNSRRTGLGFTGLADAIAAMGFQYGSKESIELAGNMQLVISKSSLNSSIDMAIDRGVFNEFDYDKEKNHEFLNRILDPKYAEKFKQYGRRNVSLTTVAPAGSVSILTRTSSGLEPAFMIYYTRKRKINPNDKNVDLTKIKPDANGDMYEQYYVFHHKFIEWYSIKQNISYADAKEFLNKLPDNEVDKLIEISPYYKSTAHEINWKDKIDLQAILQRSISHSISSTLNLHKDTTEKEISDVYKYAWESGCKGITIYRDGCREGILSNVSKDTTNSDQMQFSEHSAPKRPKVLKCDVIRFNNKGEKWIGFLGLLNDRPYEIFTGKSESFNIPSYVESGFIIRIKEDGHSRYDFQYIDSDGYKVTMEALNRAFNMEYWNYAKLLSALLRHGMPLFYVLELLTNLKMDEDNINSWKTGVRRLIKKYIRDDQKSKNLCPNCSQPLVFSEGCEKCTNCGYSRC